MATGRVTYFKPDYCTNTDVTDEDVIPHVARLQHRCPPTPFPSTMASTRIQRFGTKDDADLRICKVTQVFLDNPAKSALVCANAAALTQASDNARRRCINALPCSKPRCNAPPLSGTNPCRQRSYNYSTTELLHSRGQTFAQKQMRPSACYASLPGCDAAKHPCRNNTACDGIQQNVIARRNIAFGTNSAVPAGLFTETAALRSHITSAANNAVDACGTCMTDLPTKIPILGLERVGDLPPFTQVNGGCLNK
jgi:hypothetical protein